MNWFSKKDQKPKPKPKAIVVKTTIVKGRSEYDMYDEFTVTVEGSGFLGHGKGMSISSAFEDAYEDLMTHMAGAVLSE